MWRRLTALVMALSLGAMPVAASAERRSLAHSIFYEDVGYALNGYDPVSFFAAGEPQHGAMSFALEWKGVTWLFASAENQAMFEANPRAYAPRFGGYCAYGVSMGKLISGSVNSFEIREGALYMLHSPEVQARWDQSREERLQAAQQNWPDILRE